jgi:hypothetical protein
MNYYLLYFVSLGISWLFSIIFRKQEKGLFIIPYLLSLSLLVEIVTRVMSNGGLNNIFIYHIYIPLEYGLWAIYFYHVNSSGRVKKAIKFSVPLFIILSLILSFKVVSFSVFPNLQLNIEGVLLIVWAIISIFTVEITHANLFSRPVFWICVGVLVFYCAIFTFVGIYNYILDYKSSLFESFKIYLLVIPNCFLYTCISISFICSHRIKK